MNFFHRLFVTCSSADFAVAGASAGVVINEIHYNPDVKTEPVEFVELYNTGPGPVNLSGWNLSDGGALAYTFPPTNVVAGGFVVVAQNPAYLFTKYAAAGALGPFNSSGGSALSKYGDKLTLRNPASQVEDEVQYGAGFPWPTSGEPPGYSLELINPTLDNNLAGNWRISVGSGQPSSQLLLPDQSTWRYLPGTNEASNPTTVWRQPGFDDSSWLSGGAPVGYGENFIVTALPNMTSNYISVFFRQTFVINGPIPFSSLLLEGQFDDGAKVWINGVNVLNVNLPAGEVPYTDAATVTVEALTFIPYILNSPASYLVSGTNVIAVQGHNASLGASSDFVMDLRLSGQIGVSGNGPTPGRVNSVYATNAPPAIRQVDHKPNMPTNGQPVTISAKVTDPDGVASVVLQYQIISPGAYIELSDAAYTNAANWISVPMNDTGVNGDVTAGDAVFTCVLPGSVQMHRRLIRYRITVTDAGNRSVRVPYADDPQPNFAYFCYDGVPAYTGAAKPGDAGSNGVPFTVGAEEMNRIPVYQLITKSNEFAEAIGWAPGLPNNKYGGDDYLWTGTLVVDGKVYDHIGFRCRGGVWRYSMGKNAMKFRLNRGHDLEVKDNWGHKLNAPWRRLSFRPNIQQGDFLHRGEQGLFESVGYRLFDLAGANGLKSVQLQFRVIDDARESVAGNQYVNDFYGLWLGVEEDDGRFLEERGLPDGNIYDMEGGSGTLNHTGSLGPTDKSDLNYLLTYGGASSTEAWWRTNLNLSAYYSYQCIIQGIHQYDIADGKNYFYYRNPATRLWTPLPWDLDLTWADNMYRSDSTRGDEPFRSRVLANFAVPGTFPNIGIEFRNRVREIRDLLFNTDQAFQLIDEYWHMTRGPEGRPSIVDADRAQWDYNPVMNNSAVVNLSKAGNYHFYQWQNEPGTSNHFGGANQLMKNYVRYRSTNASLNGTSTGLDGVALDNARPSRPALSYTGPSNFPINRLTFHSGNYSGANPFGSMRWRIAEVTAPGAPPYDSAHARKYEMETVWESGPLATFNADITVPAEVLRAGSRYRVRVLHTDATGRNSNWSAPVEFTCGEPANVADLLNYLRITEVMFHPPPGGFEYIELYNASSTVALDLSGVRLAQGVDFTCLSGTTLAPGAYLLVAGTTNIAGFRAFYGVDPSVTVVGPFDGALNNSGEQVTLRTAAGGTDIVEFNFSDGRGWPIAADGNGHSLVLIDSALPAEGSGAGNYSGNWRSSTYLRGSAGRADAPAPAGILLNEIVAHTDFTVEFDSNDWIELYNSTAAPITLGPGWYLSDDGSSYTNLMKWAIPASTVIAAHGFASFDEVTGFHNPTNIGFGLNKGGEQVFLSYLPGTAQDRIVDSIPFKGQENDWSLGRYPDGGPYWHALTPRTRDLPNAAPSSRLVISELHYHPPDIHSGTNILDNSLDEFIEIQNATTGPLTLQNTNGTWRLNGGVVFDFPTNLTVNAGSYLLVVNFDPSTNASQLAAFKSLYGIFDPSLVILGPYSGKLANNSDRVAIERPQHGDGTNDPLNWVVVDEVIYADQPPFPCGSDGTGNSIQRLSALQHGCDPANWSAEPPTAGRARANLPAGLPAITSAPRDQIVATNGTASFSVSVCGTPPFQYQWRFNGSHIAGATNVILTLAGVTIAQAGSYDVVVSNPAGSIPSAAATLIVQFPPFIATEPQPATVVRDLSAQFSVTAGGTAPFQYQWRFNGGNLPGATNRILMIDPVRTNDAGFYSVLINNAAGSVLSTNASLTVLIPATITQQPTNQTVTLTASPSSATFNVVAAGTGTLVYQWRLDGVNISWGTSAALTVTNVQKVDAGNYSVVVTDSIGSAISSNAALIVLVVPVFILQPGPQSAVTGGSVTFSGSITGFPPPYTFELRNPSTNLQVKVENEGTVFFTLSNLTTNETRSYRLVVKNAARLTGVASSLYALTVLADVDGDGIPDAWCQNYFGHAAGQAGDHTRAVDDFDGDGMSNGAEYIAGTDPTNPLSYLKVEPLTTQLSSNLVARIEFNAVSNRTYTVQSSPALAPAVWSRVSDIVATTNNHPVILLDPQPAQRPMRTYRLVTPKLP